MPQENEHYKVGEDDWQKEACLLLMGFVPLIIGYAVIISLVLTYTGNILIFVLTALICYIILLLLLFRWKTYFVDPEIKDS